MINYAGSGGTEKYVYTLIKHQIADGHSCMLVYNQAGQLSEQTVDLGVEVRQLTMAHLLDRSAVQKLRGICRQRGIQVIHAHYPRENCIALQAAGKAPIKVITTTHLVFACNWVWRIINRIFSPRNHAVLCVCGVQVPQMTQNGVRADKLKVIHNGVPLDRVENAGALRAQIREEFHIPRDAFVITTLTRYEPVKGVDMLLDTAKILKKRLPEARFLVAGTGSQYEQIREEVQREGLADYFIQAGFRKDTDAILAAGDVFVNTSRSEALSFAITEAMSLYKPVVITDVGGNPEIVPGDGDGGYLVPFGDAEGMADILYMLAKDSVLQAAVGEKARQRAAAHFSEDVMYQKIMEIYEL